MVEVKDKVVTVESLSALHEHNKNTYMPMVDPTGSRTMIIDGINDEGIAYSIYYLTLQQLLSNNLIIKDIEFAKMVNNYVKNSQVSNEKFLYEVNHETINRSE